MRVAESWRSQLASGEIASLKVAVHATFATRTTTVCNRTYAAFRKIWHALRSACAFGALEVQLTIHQHNTCAVLQTFYRQNPVKSRERKAHIVSSKRENLRDACLHGTSLHTNMRRISSCTAAADSEASQCACTWPGRAVSLSNVRRPTGSPVRRPLGGGTSGRGIPVGGTYCVRGRTTGGQ